MNVILYSHGTKVPKWQTPRRKNICPFLIVEALLYIESETPSSYHSLIPSFFSLSLYISAYVSIYYTHIYIRAPFTIYLLVIYRGWEIKGEGYIYYPLFVVLFCAGSCISFFFMFGGYEFLIYSFSHTHYTFFFFLSSFFRNKLNTCRFHCRFITITRIKSLFCTRYSFSSLSSENGYI